jgi:hypothetical protein
LSIQRDGIWYLKKISTIDDRAILVKIRRKRKRGRRGENVYKEDNMFLILGSVKQLDQATTKTTETTKATRTTKPARKSRPAQAT